MNFKELGDIKEDYAAGDRESLWTESINDLNAAVRELQDAVEGLRLELRELVAEAD